MKKVSILLITFITILMPLALFGAGGFNGKKTLLIINSFNADEQWSVNMSRPVERYMIKEDSINCDIVYLNNTSVKNMEDFDELCDNLFTRYERHHPSYLVLIGNFAFALRDEYVKHWGDIPMLLVTRVEEFAPLEEYFATTVESETIEINNLKPLGNLREKYNFTSVIVPDFYQENVRLMMDLNPKMKELVFMSDLSFVNKYAALNLQSIVKEQYPECKFSWLQGTQDNSRKLIELLMTYQPEVGLLLSSWAYEVTTVRGQNILTTQDLAYIPEANNPVFTMRQPYLNLGCVGGVFADNGVISQRVEDILGKMIKGENLSKIPFYVPSKYLTCVDYIEMKRFNLDSNRLPKEAIILNTPLTFIGKYGHYITLILVALLLLLGALWYKNRAQRKQISVLERHTGFINNLPMPYTKSSLWLDKNDNVVNITYGTKNAAYEELIHNNSLPDNPLHLFSNTFMSDIVHKLLTTHASVSIRHHFKRTDVYCYFIFVPIEKKNVEVRRTSDVDSAITSRLDIDVFAIDMTKDHKLQQQLKDQAITIDISMEMAQLVPWQWDFETDIISFYTYRKYIGANGTTTSDGKSTTAIKFDQFIRLLPQADAESMLNLYHSIRDGESSRIDNEFRISRAEKPDEYDWCENHGVVTDTDSDGRPLRMTGSMQYITDRKHQEEEMGLALSKAKESDMLKSAFLANMSHEIRTPLNAIVGFSNLLTTTDDQKERKEYADIINRNNELLLSLINDILDLAKIESNTITITYDLCDIHDLVSSISKTVSIRVPKGVKLNVVHFAESLVVKADAAHISQILINLLTNATKFTKRGSITVGYEVYEDENKIFFYVKDTGIGIKKENLDKVFNRFVKLNNFVQGSGLGLAICRTLVEKMGGEIGVESAGEGRGTQFWFTIPYDPQDLKVEDGRDEIIRDAFTGDNIVGEKADAPAQINENQSSSFFDSSETTQTSLGTLPDGLTVLVAEDNPSNYWLMERLMQGKFKLQHAENGRLALEMLEHVTPDIIIMDINMPEMDGYQAVEEMRKNGIETPIIAVTAYAFASDRVRILNSGFDAFVSKPVSASLLYDTIAEVWERKKLKKDKQRQSQRTAQNSSEKP